MKAAVHPGRLLSSLVRAPVDPARCIGVRPSQLVQPAGRAPQGLVLSSGVLVYRWFDLADLPRPKRRAALAAKARAWSPFAETGFLAAWFGDSAGVFAWDAQKLRKRLSDAGIGPRKELPVMVEPWLAAPAADGVHLLRRGEGVDGEIWQGSALRALRCWPATPDEAQWLNFLRGAGLGPQAAPAPGPGGAVATGTRADAAPLLTLADLQSRALGWEPVAVAAASLALMGWTASLAYQHLYLHNATRQAAAAARAAAAASAPVLAVREAALRDRERAVALTALVSGPRALAVVEHLLSRLPANAGVLLRQLEIEDRQVRLALEVPQAIERAAIVKAIEEGRWLTDVREARDSGGTLLQLTMRLDGDRPALPPPAEPATQPAAPAPGNLPPALPAAASPAMSIAAPSVAPGAEAAAKGAAR